MTRNIRSAKAAGTWMERITAEFLAARLEDDRIERRTRNGSKDRGDITGVRTPLGGRVVIECKNTVRLDLPGWLREAEAERGNDRRGARREVLRSHREAARAASVRVRPVTGLLDLLETP